jgi:hypothetical protein
VSALKAELGPSLVAPDVVASDEVGSRTKEWVRLLERNGGMEASTLT